MGTDTEAFEVGSERAGFLALPSGEMRDLFLSAEPQRSGRWKIKSDEPELTVVRSTKVRSSGGIVYYRSMPSLTELLEQQKVAYSVLERSVPVFRETVSSTSWIVIGLIGVVWGVLSGFSFADPTFFIHPMTAIFGIWAVGVLLGTLALRNREWRDGRWRDGGRAFWKRSARYSRTR